MNTNKLVDAYVSLMEHLYEVMDDTLHSIAEGLETAKSKIHQTSELTGEELDKVSGFIKRDLEHAAQHLAGDEGGSNSLSEWFKFDVEMLENFTAEAFLSLADKTRVELAHLQLLAKTDNYHTGDICAPGTFVCDACGKEIAFKTPSEIPVCPKCQATTFIRI